MTSGGMMDTRAVADRLGVKPQSVRAYLARGILIEPDARYGQSPVWSVDRIEMWIASRPGQGNRTPRR